MEKHDTVGDLIHRRLRAQPITVCERVKAAVGSSIRSLRRPSKTAAEAYGVFLPAAGNRNGTSVNNVGSNGNYWSSSPNSTDNAYNLNFNSGNVNPANNNNRNNGFSVRLVQSVGVVENYFSRVSFFPFFVTFNTTFNIIFNASQSHTTS